MYSSFNSYCQDPCRCAGVGPSNRLHPQEPIAIALSASSRSGPLSKHASRFPGSSGIANSASTRSKSPAALPHKAASLSLEAVNSRDCFSSSSSAAASASEDRVSSGSRSFPGTGQCSPTPGLQRIRKESQDWRAGEGRAPTFPEQPGHRLSRLTEGYRQVKEHWRFRDKGNLEKPIAIGGPPLNGKWGIPIFSVASGRW